ncbi:PH domain-containing protein [Pedococcus sp. NPDC057267]|uniref:PH domain-containing protein n=1 Tax=Pedococcus sp. NPDC057267 TaxID=3346077 RepID=UPI00363E5DE9
MARAGADEDAGWQHLHPLSPLLRGGIASVAVVAYVLSQQLDTLFGADREDPTGGHLGWAAVAVLVVLVLIVLGAWVSWRFSRYRVGGTLIELRTGVLFRQHRQVRFDRIQAVDVGRPLLARLVGLSEVVVQSAGGRDANLKLAFLGDPTARAVRERLVELARHSDEVATTTVVDIGVGEQPAAAGGEGLQASPVTEATRVLTVPNARIVQSLLYTGPALTFLLAVPALLTSLALGAGGMVAWLGPTTLGIGGSLLKRLTREANFELHQQGDRLRVRHGLTDLRTTTVPLHRVQAVELHQPLPWRPLGWWRIRVNVAGVGGSREEDTETVVLPVGTRAEALGVLELLRPGIPGDVAVGALEGIGATTGFVTASRRAARLDPLGWRRLGYAALPDCLVLRRGRLHRTAQVVPHARIQSMRVTQGPLQRHQGVATVSLVSTPGPVRPVVEHLDVEEAHRLLDEQSARSGAARRLAVRAVP